MTATIVLCLVLLSGSPECQPAIPTDRQLTRTEMLHTLDLGGWPVEHWDDALNVAWAESRWKPWEERPEFGTVATGLFQVHTSPWLRFCDAPNANMLDPVVSAKIAYCVFEKHDNNSWTQWGYYPDT